jgi:hypothetical protein
MNRIGVVNRRLHSEPGCECNGNSAKVALESWHDHHHLKALALVSVRLLLAYAVVWLVGNAEACARWSQRAPLSPLLWMDGPASGC